MNYLNTKKYKKQKVDDVTISIVFFSKLPVENDEITEARKNKLVSVVGDVLINLHSFQLF
jgi:hypothetical protein